MSKEGYFQDKHMVTKSFVKSLKKYSEDDISMESTPRDLNKEYNFLDRFGSTSRMSNLFALMADACSNNTWMFLHLKETQEMMDNYFKCLALKKRYTELVVLSNIILNYDETGFHLHEHTFETLDEVEKALKNKAFL